MYRVLSAIHLLYATIIFVALMLIILPFALLFSIILPVKIRKKGILALIRIWSFTFSVTSFFWVTTKNKQTIDTSKAHIYVGNHGSYLDAIAVCVSIPQFFTALGKIEMTKIPIFGLIYKRYVVLIDRASKESRAESVAMLKHDISCGQSVLIFPEGTMNKSSAPLTEFYDGAFRIAIETQTAILPFVMINNGKLLPRKDPLKARPGIITTIFLPEVDVTGLLIEDLQQLKLKVYHIMEEAIKKGAY